MAALKYALWLLSGVTLGMMLLTTAWGKSPTASSQGASRVLSETKEAESPGATDNIPAPAIKTSFDTAHINWRQFEGETISVLLSGHPIQVTALRLLSEFESLTGIKVVIDVQPEEDFFQKLNFDLRRGKHNIDVFMTSPLYHWQYAKAGWIEDLRPYIEDRRLTDKAWFNPEDFFPILWKASMWDGTIGGGLGKGGLYSIPVWWEGCTLAYRKDLAEKYGLKAPKNWNDLYRQSSRISERSNGKMFGFACRGIRSWSQIHTYHLTMMASQGGRDLNPLTGRADFNSPIGIEVGKYWVKMIQETSAPDWPGYNWYEVVSQFQAGKYYSVMDANALSTIIEAENSPIRGKVGYLLPPPGTHGRQSSLWLWSLGINAFSRHKGAAWYFTQWLSSKSVLRQSVDSGNWMAPRRSVWFDPEVEAFLRDIDNGRWYENSTAIITRLGAMHWSPNPLAPMLGNLWAGAIQDAWRGKYTVEQAFEKAADEVNVMMQRAGYGAPP